jgi:general secretion pathway protein K
MATRPPACRQRGVALITALLVVAVAGVLAVELIWQTNLDVQRTEGLLSWDQAKQFGYGAEDYAATAIQQVFDQQDREAAYSRKSETELCYKGRSFSLPLADEAAAEGGMSGGICDLQGRFNLNNLVVAARGPNYGKKDELVVKQFKRLLAAVDELDDTIELHPDDIDQIVDSTVDWIDADTVPGFHGAEDGEYTSRDPPYQAANFWFTSTSELLAVKGMTAEIYEALRPYIAALPLGATHTAINVNTASVPVFMSLGDDITATNAEQWIADSLDEPFENSTQFTNFIDAAVVPYIGVTTSYFGLQGTISVGTTRLDMYSLLERNGSSVQVRLRTFDSVEAEAAVNPESVAIEDDTVIADDE